MSHHAFVTRSLSKWTCRRTDCTSTFFRGPYALPRAAQHFPEFAPNVLNPRHDIAEDLRPERQEPEPPHIKEEVEDEEVHHIKEDKEPISIKKEEEEACPHIKQEEENMTKFLSTVVPLKREDEGQIEESRGAEPPSSCSSQHMTAEGDRDH
ncbi:uncharacterized protein LOC133472567 isoform X10 [Phyllopteryx taeniolatus]|uniref:uncharacterized protein LOC133472567 isoform X10 n=1 Tax=Phyllopteryx taeniolatus TaxID=161469 RepID=UPI002AD469A4|nr:uncharacterized protein LOC133472567 isoform X10 [Phyllopteryx taeniolatus]